MITATSRLLIADELQHMGVQSSLIIFVKDQSANAKHNQRRDIKIIQDQILTEFGVEIEPVINQKYLKCLSELRSYARNETKELKSPIMRLFQIEEHLLKHIERLDR